MNNSRWMRIVSAILCAVLLLAGIPSWAEFAEIPGDESVNIEIPAPDPTEVPPAETELPAAETPAPTEEPAAEATEQPTAEPAAKATDAPAQQPETPAQPEAPAETAVPQNDPLADAVAPWIAALNAQALSSDYEKALWLYNQLILNFVPGSADDALTALNTFGASPLGYADAYAALMRAAGFEIQTVIGRDAIWNVAKLEDAWTHIDVFADDAPDCFGLHFGLTDSAMALDHSWDASVVPACVDTKANYFVHERGYRAFTDQSGLSALLSSAAEKRAEKLFVYNAGAISSVEETVDAIVPEIDGIAAAEVSEQNCYAAVLLNYDALTAKPTAEVATVAAPKATSIVPNASSVTLGVGEKVSVSGITVLPAGAKVASITYASQSTKIATVDAEGNVTGKTVGSTTITLTSDTGLTATVAVTVKKAPTAVKISADRSVIGGGEKLQVNYTLSSGAAGKVTFSSSNKAIADIDPDTGLITANEEGKVGKVTITAKTYNGKKKSGTITVKSAPTSITLNKTEITIGQGDTFTPAVTLSSGSVSKLTYASSDSTVADVDPGTGKITAAKNKTGEAVVTYTTHNKLPATITVKVVSAPEAVNLTAHHTALGLKEKIQLNTELVGFTGDTCAVKYKSSKTSVATVSAAGVVTAKKKGTATITVTTYNNLKATLKITVKKAPTSIKIVADRTVLGAGEEMKLGYKLSSGAGGGVTFTVTAGGEFAEVTPDGLVTALKPGKATITAKTYNGKKKSGTLTVKETPTSISVSNAPTELGVGATKTLSASVNANSAGKLYYRLADEASAAYASIDAKGKIKALKAGGTANFVISTYPAAGVELPLSVEIKPAPTKVSLPASSISLGVGDTYMIQPILNDGAAANFTFSTNNKKLATVTSVGVVKGVKVGKATITVKTHNGKTAKLTVNVKKKPSSVAANPASITIAVDETATMGAKIPSDSATTYTFVNQTPDIISLDGNVVKGLTEGTGKVQIKTHNGKTATCTVNVAPKPKGVTLTLADTAAVGQTLTPSYALEPSNAHTTPTYTVTPITGDAEVKDGKIVAKAAGTVKVRIETHVPGVAAEKTITILPAPESIKFGPTTLTLDVNDYADASKRSQFRLNPAISPVDAYKQITYKIATAGYFTIDADGNITPIKRGSSKVTATTHNGKSATVTVQIVDRFFPESLKLAETPPAYLDSGRKETYTPKLTVSPADGVLDMKWTSSNANIASVDASTGQVTALTYGKATITGTSQRNTKLSVSFKIIVTNSQRCLIMPTHRTTDSSLISTVYKEIDSVKASASAELDELVAKGWISSSERNTRQGYIDRAFSHYRFAWTPNAKEYYWKAANSEGGQKDFKKGTYYFGMPYTQTNRVNTPSSVVSNGYFTNSGSYYTMLTGKFAQRKYPGSDCSSFVSMAIWGTGSSRKSDNTTKIASASYYTTLASKYAKDMRPGDILVKGGSHVVMFLYYANEARTQFVVIEQGGGGDDPYSNCISTSIRDISYYSSRGYKLRRVDGLNTTCRVS